jgi:hypothetical protein
MQHQTEPLRISVGSSDKFYLHSTSVVMHKYFVGIIVLRAITLAFKVHIDFEALICSNFMFPFCLQSKYCILGMTNGVAN